MAAVVSRYKEEIAQIFDSNLKNNNTGESSQPVQAIIKNEINAKSSCPYTAGDAKDKIGQFNTKDEDKGEQESLPPNLSPEYSLEISGSGGKDGEYEKNEGEDEMKTSFACVCCNESFSDKKTRDEHMLDKHEMGEKKLYGCSVCQKQFTHRSSRDIHLRVHTGQRPYQCDICKKRFRVSSHLRDHVRTHTGERPFKCEVCERGFKQSSDMKKHRKTHFKTQSADRRTTKETNTTYTPVSNECATSYTIVRPEQSFDEAEHNPTKLRSPTDLKLVIKRERKTKDPTSLRSNDGATKMNQKDSADDSFGLRATRTTLDTNPPSQEVSQVQPTNDRANDAILRPQRSNASTPTTVIRTKDRHNPENSESSGPSGYAGHASWASIVPGFNRGYSSGGGISFPYTLSSSPSNRSVYYSSEKNGQTENIQKHHVNEVGMAESGKLNEDNISMQMDKRTENGCREDEPRWDMKNVVIKTEKLSPRANDATTFHHDTSTTLHNEPTYTEDTSMNVDDGLADQTLSSDEERQRKHINHDTTSASNIMNAVNDQVHESDAVEDPTLSSSSSLLKEAMEISEVIEALDSLKEGKRAASHSMPESQAIVRKPVVVKLRRDKIEGATKKNGVSLTVRKPIKITTEGQEENVQCSHCQETFHSMEEFTAHRCGKTDKTFKCNICNKTFARATLLRQHSVLHQGSKRFRFKCNYCGRAFRHRSHLRDHERIHTGERPFKCSFCPKAFKQSSDHRKHENLHTGTTRYRCEKCSLDFKRCDALKRHAMMHTKGEVTLLKCEKCRSLFATADGHMSHVCSNKPYRYRCQICPKRFSDADELRGHCYEQHGEHSTSSCLKCEFCKAEFSNLKELDEHLTTHRLEKTHKCRTCDQRFSLLNQLVEHVKLHSGSPKGTNETPSTMLLPSNEYEHLQNDSEQRSQVSNQPRDFNQRKEIVSEDKLRVTPSSNNSSLRYDFIPSSYQSLVHSTSTPTDVSLRNWTRSYNLYLPYKSNEVIHINQDKTTENDPIPSRCNSTPSINSEIFFRGNSIITRAPPAAASMSSNLPRSSSPTPRRSPVIASTYPENIFPISSMSQSRRHSGQINNETSRSSSPTLTTKNETKINHVYITNDNMSSVDTVSDASTIPANSNIYRTATTFARMNSRGERIDAEISEGRPAERTAMDFSRPKNKRKLSQSPVSEDVIKRKYTCLNCRSMFYKESSLVNHVCNILSETLYCCLVCMEEFEDYEDLQTHMRIHWKPVVFFKCGLCKERVRTERQLKQHNLLHLENFSRGRSMSEEGSAHKNEYMSPRDEDKYHSISMSMKWDDSEDPKATHNVTTQSTAKTKTSPHASTNSLVSDDSLPRDTIRFGQSILRRSFAERRRSEEDFEETGPVTPQLSNENSHVFSEGMPTPHSKYVTYFSQRKPTSNGHPNIYPHGSNIPIAANHIATESSGFYPVTTNLYSPARLRLSYSAQYK